MQLLNIFNTGGVTLGLSLAALVILFMCWKDIPKGMKQPYGHYDHMSGKFIQQAPKTKFYQINKFWIGLCVVVIYILVLWLIVAPDYKGV